MYKNNNDNNNNDDSSLELFRAPGDLGGALTPACRVLAPASLLLRIVFSPFNVFTA